MLRYRLKHASLTKKSFSMTIVATIKGGAVSSLSTRGGLFPFVNDTKDERNEVEARRGAY